MKRVAGRVVATGSLLFLLMAGECFACPNCKDSFSVSGGVPGQAAPADVARGFNTSILAMALMPFLLAGGTIWTVARELK